MQLHGSRLLGLVRAGAYALYGREAPFPVSGTDQVYGINASRFLADRGEADQLVLSLYGQLAAAMTPGHVRRGRGGERRAGRRRRERAMYLPPNGAANAAFLETLRLLLVHETPDGARARLLDAARAGSRRAGASPSRRRRRASARSRSRSRRTHAARRHGAGAAPGEAAHAAAAAAPSGRPPHRPRHARRRPYRPVDVTTGTIDLSGTRGRCDSGLAFGKRRKLRPACAASSAPPTGVRRARRGCVADADRRRIFTGVPYDAKPAQVRIWKIPYRAHDGQRRKAYVVLPAWYGRSSTSAIPLVISPHGRGVSARTNARALGRAARARHVRGDQPRGRRAGSSALLVGLRRPDRRPGADAAIARRTLPWLQIDTQRDLRDRRQHGRPGDAAAARAASRACWRVRRPSTPSRTSPASTATSRACRATRRARSSATARSAARLQIARARRARRHARTRAPCAYAVRSPVTYVRSIAASCVPLQLWWSPPTASSSTRRSSRRRCSSGSGAEPEGAGPGLRRLLGPFRRDAGGHAATARARGLRADPGASEPALVRHPGRAGAGRPPRAAATGAMRSRASTRARRTLPEAPTGTVATPWWWTGPVSKH